MASLLQGEIRNNGDPVFVATVADVDRVATAADVLDDNDPNPICGDS